MVSVVLWSMWTIMVVVVQRVGLIYKSHLCRQAVIAMLAALVMFDKLGTNGYYSELRVPFGFCQDKGWCQWTPGPGQLKASVLVSMVVGGAAAPPEQRPAACRLLNRAHLQKTGDPPKWAVTHHQQPQKNKHFIPQNQRAGLFFSALTS